MPVYTTELTFKLLKAEVTYFDITHNLKQKSKVSCLF